MISRLRAMTGPCRILCLIVLVAFAVVCGIHLTGAHHDADPDAIGAATFVGLIALIFYVTSLRRISVSASLLTLRPLTSVGSLLSDSFNLGDYPLRR